MKKNTHTHKFVFSSGHFYYRTGKMKFLDKRYPPDGVSPNVMYCTLNLLRSFSCNVVKQKEVQLKGCCRDSLTLCKQSGSGTEPEPETGTVRTVFPETESGT